MYRKLSIVLIFISIFACTKESDIVEYATKSDDYYASNDQTQGLGNSSESGFNYLETKANKDFSNEYLITREMIESYIRSNSKHKRIKSFECYPSEEVPTLYMVNFEDGWAVFPSDSRFGITLANSQRGQIDISDKSHSLGFQLLIQDYHNHIEHFRGRPLSDYNESSVLFWDHFRMPENSGEHVMNNSSNLSSTRDGMLWVVVDAGPSTRDSVMTERWHLVGAEWGQKYPWNRRMPAINNQRCVTGCAPLAVAQVLNYFNVWSTSPSGLYHSINESSRSYHSNDPRYDAISITLDRSDYVANSSRWSQMSYLEQYGNSDGFDYASDLILDVGVRLGTRYGLSGSGVSITSNNFFDLDPVNISYSWDSYSYQIADAVIANLINRKPVIITAGKSSNDDSRHTWIIDGVYSYRTFFQNDYELWPVSMIPEGARIVDLMSESQLSLRWPDYYPGMVYHVRDGYVDTSQFYMNFGEDGRYKWDLYSVWPGSSWEGYDVIKSVHYNLTPGDLLIQ